MCVYDTVSDTDKFQEMLYTLEILQAEILE